MCATAVTAAKYMLQMINDNLVQNTFEDNDKFGFTCYCIHPYILDREHLDYRRATKRDIRKYRYILDKYPREDGLYLMLGSKHTKKPVLFSLDTWSGGLGFVNMGPDDE